MIKGLVSKLQRYATKDGPGLRTTVFMAGCNLQCRWCANPGLLKQKIQVFYYKERCHKCGICVQKAKNQSIQLTNDGCIIDRERCENILEMVNLCPYDAYETSASWYDVSTLVNELLRDEVFFLGSGGGVTFSGGEAALQHDFILECCRQLKQHGIHICLDTAGLLPWKKLDCLLNDIDMVLYDIKAIDERIHYQCTAQGNAIILDNLRNIANKKIPIIIRLVIVPGENDDFSDIKARLDYIKELGDAIVRIDILKYHELGVGKYDKLGMRYPLRKKLEVGDKLMEKILHYAQNIHLTIYIENE